MSYRSGVSVRTIRNVECGLIERPRRKSVDLLLDVLDPEHRHVHRAPLDRIRPGTGAWRGRGRPTLPWSAVRRRCGNWPIWCSPTRWSRSPARAGPASRGWRWRWRRTSARGSPTAWPSSSWARSPASRTWIPSRR
ncbi:hypothetical protein ACFQ9X_08760 [Catenulispora yoronensis]